MTATVTTGRPPEENLGTTTFWLPMSTPWPSGLGCETSFFAINGAGGIVAAWDPGVSVAAMQEYTCQPPQVTAWWNQVQQKTAVTSLGPVVCPQAYKTAAVNKKDSSSTLVFCCPSSYSFKGPFSVGAIGQCVSMLSPSQVLTLAIRSAPFTTISTVKTASSAYGIPVNGWAFQTEPAGARPTSPATAGPTSPAPSRADSPSPSSSSAGPIAGAVIGGIAFGVCVVLAAVWFRKKRQAVRNRARNPGAHGNASTPFNLPGDTESLLEQEAGSGPTMPPLVHETSGSTRLSKSESKWSLDRSSSPWGPFED